MKVFYDHIAFFTKFSGISKYVSELMRHIPRSYWYTSTLLTNNEHLKDTGMVRTMGFFPNTNLPKKARLMMELNMPYTKFKLRTAKWDVFHATWYADRYIADVGKKPVVVTIHDLIYDIFYKGRLAEGIRQKFIRQGRASAARADMLISVSEYTRQDMMREWGVSPDKIKVIHHGVDKEKQPILGSRMVEPPYIFFAGGGRGLNKNFEHLLQAFAALAAKHRDLRLVCSGSPFRADEISQMQELKIADRCVQMYATAQQMAQLYHDAEMTAVPSYYEGFGFPLLEAMVYDCPVAASNASCLPEIGGNAAIYFDPYSAEEMSAQMSLLLGNSALRKQQAKLGAERLTHFSWEKCAQQHLELYKSVV